MATTPFFSPDGRWVGFWRAEDRILRKVPIAGGAPIEIGPTDVPHVALWEPNDEIVGYSAGSTDRLWSIPAGGGTPRPIPVRDLKDGETIALRANVPGGNDLLLAAAGPEGTWLDVLSRQTGLRRRLLRTGNEAARFTRSGHLVYAAGDTIFAVPLDRRFAPAGPAVPVMHGIDHYFWHSNVAISDNGTVVYVPIERVNEAELAWMDGHGNTTPVPGGRGAFVRVSLSPDGREVAAAIVEGMSGSGQVWILDLARGTRRLLVAGTDPIWSRDGTFITYSSDRSGGAVLCRRRADGTGPEECLVRHRSGFPIAEDWSPDGRSLLFTEYTSRGDSDIWIYSDGVTRPLLAGPANEANATFSPDGRFIAFEADDGGVGQVYVQPFPGPGPRTVISSDEGSSPSWRDGGRQLYYWSGRKLMAVPVQTGPVVRAGHPEMQLAISPPWASVRVSADGRRVLALAPRTMEQPPELGVVLNWLDELERLAPHPR
jgi:hypothetical protein